MAFSCICCAAERESHDSLISQFEDRLIVEAADSSEWNAVLAAEDSRAETPEALSVLLDGLASERPAIQRVSARAIGRLERGELVSHLIPLLVVPEPRLRADVVNAIGQSMFGSDGAPVLDDLLARLTDETDPTVRGVVAQTIGRLEYRMRDDLRRAEDALIAAAENAPPETILGIARGLASMFRRPHDGRAPSARTHEWLYRLAQYRPSASNPDDIRVRRLALATLVGDARVDVGLVAVALQDPDVEVRRIAATAIAVLPKSDGRETLESRALSDLSPRVRYAALQAMGRRMARGADCGIARSAMDDADAHVALLALDLLDEHCASARDLAVALEAEVGRLSESDIVSWHRPAHALLALARIAPEQAAEPVSMAAEHQIWQVRMYAARASTTLRSVEHLQTLASDDHDNVRETAIRGLFSLVGYDADSVYIAQLARPDYQLVITAAGLLRGSPNGRLAVPALMTALERITAERRETSRDPRNALLERLEELAGRAQADYLASYLYDFDPVIAESAARVLGTWTGRTWTANPRAIPSPALPSYAQLRALVDSHAVVQMQGGTSFELRLLPFEAPTNVWRFAQLARQGYFDGLTFHRVVPGFVIQGGSPGANEYMGDGPFTRDELIAESHLRGTVGISTRGRDTGDGQIFVNLADNPRLDHNYTIIGEIVAGIEAVDQILEGAVIERVFLH